MITLNPNDKGSGVILSNNNLTTSFNCLQSVRATEGKLTGKWYWEITTDINSSNLIIGISTKNETLTNPMAQDIYGWAYYQLNGAKNYNNSDYSYGSSYAGQHNIGIALDLDNHTISFYKDGVNQGIAYSSIIYDVIYPTISNYSSNINIATINFGAASFKYSIPAGYKAYDIQKKYLIQDGNNIDNSLDGITLTNDDILPYTVDKFKTYGMNNLTNINSTVLSKIVNQKYNIGMLK